MIRNLLLLDEPTASLYPDTADCVREQIEDYCRARAATIVLASHNMAEVERLADRVIMLERGQILPTRRRRHSFASSAGPISRMSSGHRAPRRS